MLLLTACLLDLALTDPTLGIPLGGAQVVAQQVLTRPRTRRAVGTQPGPAYAVADCLPACLLILPTYPLTAALTRVRGLQGPRCRGRMPALMGLPFGVGPSGVVSSKHVPVAPPDVSQL